MRIRIQYEVTRETRPYFSVFFIAPSGERAMTLYSNHCSEDLQLAGDGVVECVIPEVRLTSGEYSLTLEFGREGEEMRAVDTVPDATSVRIQLGHYLGRIGLIPNQGYIAQQSFWSTVDTGLAAEQRADRRKVS
jgi:hypothetical protein